MWEGGRDVDNGDVSYTVTPPSMRSNSSSTVFSRVHDHRRRRKILQEDFLSTMEGHFTEEGRQGSGNSQQWRRAGSTGGSASGGGGGGGGGREKRHGGRKWNGLVAGRAGKEQIGEGRAGGGAGVRELKSVNSIFGVHTLEPQGRSTGVSPQGSSDVRENSGGYVKMSSVKRPESRAIDQYVHARVIPAWANHLQATCTEPPAVPRGSLPLLFLDFGPHLHLGIFPALGTSFMAHFLCRLASILMNQHNPST
jgi:hypothetical protein